MQPITTHDELLELAGDDPWVRFALDPALPGAAWVHDRVALLERSGRHRRGLWVAPLRPGMPSPPSEDQLAEETGRVRAALLALRESGHLRQLEIAAVSVPQEHAGVAHEVLDLADGGDWDWMWTAAAPEVHPREPELEVLDDRADAEELRTFAHEHNPRVWTSIGDGAVTRWVGVRDRDGALLAVGGAEREASGVPHLAGILTATHARGQGLGELVSSALTRWAVAEHGVSTLGMFSDNDVARRLYQRLGYRTARAWHSRSLAG